jgi:hypothetical protein
MSVRDSRARHVGGENCYKDIAQYFSYPLHMSIKLTVPGSQLYFYQVTYVFGLDCSSALKMETVCSSGMLVSTYEFTRRHNPGE